MSTGTILLIISATFSGAFLLGSELTRKLYDKTLQNQEEAMAEYIQKVKARVEYQIGTIPEK